MRLQLQKQAVAGDLVNLPKYKGMLGTVGTIAREEGLSALWKGIVPGLHRQCLYGGLRIGLYEPVSNDHVTKILHLSQLMYTICLCNLMASITLEF